MFHLKTLAAALLLFTVVTETQAQVRSRSWYGGRGVPVPIPYFGGGYGAQTAASSNAYGMSELVRANGEAAENYSVAAINNQQANSMYIENRKAWNDAYWSMKRRAQSEIATDRAEDKVARDKYLAEQRQAAQQRALETRSTYNEYSGELTWPTVLTTDEYAAAKTQLDGLLQVWSQAPQTPGLAEEIETLTSKMKGQLRKNIKEYQANDYIQARQFLDGLEKSVKL